MEPQMNADTRLSPVTSDLSFPLVFPLPFSYNMICICRLLRRAKKQVKPGWRLVGIWPF